MRTHKDCIYISVIIGIKTRSIGRRQHNRLHNIIDLPPCWCARAPGTERHVFISLRAHVVAAAAVFVHLKWLIIALRVVCGAVLSPVCESNARTHAILHLPPPTSSHNNSCGFYDDDDDNEAAHAPDYNPHYNVNTFCNMLIKSLCADDIHQSAYLRQSPVSSVSRCMFERMLIGAAIKSFPLRAARTRAYVSWPHIC